jgi:hypothetical protein
MALQLPPKCWQMRDNKQPDPPQIYQLKAGKYLLTLECSRGAYQPSQVFFLWNTSERSPTAALLNFPVLKANGVGRLSLQLTDEVWGTVSFDAHKRILQVLNRFRAPGDCGVLMSYRIRGAEPATVGMRLKDVCDGRGADHPNRWRKIDLGKLATARNN